MAQASRKPLGRPQTADELKFYARNHLLLTILSMIIFLPLGAIGFYFSRKTDEANRCSDWVDAYRNSTRTIWLDVFAILIGLGIVFVVALVL
ncbi:transmembrane protein PMIS2 [Arvicanthis niloticus]|uniref:transmembrane protein PMIS2 n=1 Tax=Arvicanthis niloticus TaxID=61156 RepID=UPI00402BB597